jgi:hypothetical protein
MDLQEDGVANPALLSRHVLHWMVVFEAQMHIQMKVALPVHVTASFVTSRSGNLDACSLKFCQRKEAAVLPDEGKIPAVGEVIQRVDSPQLIERHLLIVRRLSPDPAETSEGASGPQNWGGSGI